MMTREDAIDTFEDVVTGLLMRAYADVAPRLGDEDDARIGRRMRAQRAKARKLIGQVFDAGAASAAPAANGVPKDAPPARK